MPLQSWAGTVTSLHEAHLGNVQKAGDNTSARSCAVADLADGAPVAAARLDTRMVDGADNRVPALNPDSPAPGPTDSPEPLFELQPGVDLAEQLIPSAPLRFAAIPAIAGPPRYAGEILPEPHLPRLPRPPRG